MAIQTLETSRAGLTPTQQRALAELLGAGQARPTFDPDLGPALRTELEQGLAPVLVRCASDRPLSVSKAALGQLHRCEGLWLAEQAQGFSWSARTARGTVAHKAVELAVLLSEHPAPLDLVDLAIERLIDGGGDWGPGEWLLDAPAAEVAELRGAAADWVTKFQDTFPPLQRVWRPRLESSLAVDLCGGAVVLRGKVDLALGKADGSVARVLIIDFKTGPLVRQHVDDLRFYALLETLRVGVPPFRLATFCLDSGTWYAEDVDEDLLAVAVRRTVAGTAKLVELRHAEAPRAALLTPGTACRWCPAADNCPNAMADPD